MEENPVASSARLEHEEGGKDAVSCFLNNFCYALSYEDVTGGLMQAVM